MLYTLKLKEGGLPLCDDADFKQKMVIRKKTRSGCNAPGQILGYQTTCSEQVLTKPKHANI